LGGIFYFIESTERLRLLQFINKSFSTTICANKSIVSGGITVAYFSSCTCLNDKLLSVRIESLSLVSSEEAVRDRASHYFEMVISTMTVVNPDSSVKENTEALTTALFWPFYIATTRLSF
jgi:hypothetical protein